MTSLFDTNAWLRLADEPEKISAQARRRLRSVRGPAILSAINIWEVSLKLRSVITPSVVSQRVTASHLIRHAPDQLLRGAVGWAIIRA